MQTERDWSRRGFLGAAIGALIATGEIFYARPAELVGTQDQCTRDERAPDRYRIAVWAKDGERRPGRSIWAPSIKDILHEPHGPTFVAEGITISRPLTFVGAAVAGPTGRVICQRPFEQPIRAQPSDTLHLSYSLNFALRRGFLHVWEPSLLEECDITRQNGELKLIKRGVS